KNQPLRGNMTHGPSGCQGVPNRPEFREAATTLRAQCETLDQPAALAAYLNPLLKEAGLTRPTAAHPSGGPVQYCSARDLRKGVWHDICAMSSCVPVKLPG